MLDAIAVTEEASRRTVYDPLLGLERAQTLRDSVLERYNLDVGRRHSRAGRNQKAQQPLGGGEKSRLTEGMASTSMFSVKDDAINQTNYSLDVTAASVLSMPTPLTFNAVIRTAASRPPAIDTGSIILNKPLIMDKAMIQRRRDAVLEEAFGTYDCTYHHSCSTAERNSATYRYMFEVVGLHMPPGPSRGNIVRALFENCADEGCLDNHVLDTLALLPVDDQTQQEGRRLESFDEDVRRGAKDFGKWLDETRQKYDKSKNGYGFPLKWSRNKKSRRWKKIISFY